VKRAVNHRKEQLVDKFDSKGAKAMFDKAKVARGEFSEDLLDHLDPGSVFELDIGGEG
jgi:hypothetical protein